MTQKRVIPFDVEQLQARLAAVESLCNSFDPSSGSGRARAFVADIRAAARGEASHAQ